MKVRKTFVADALKDGWVALNDVISEFNAEECLYALELENERVPVRESFRKRLNQRYTAIKTAEVRKELDG